MIVAIPVWQGRVSPVFDVAGQVLLVEWEDSVEVARREEPLTEEVPDRRAERIAERGVDTLICGAVSRPLEAMLMSRGIEVIPRVCGSVDEVLAAFQNGQLQDERFAMPGCCGRGGGRRRRQRGCRSGKGKNRS